MSEEIASQALALGARLSEGSCGVILFGGEPLLCRDLIQKLVREARERERRRAGRFHFKLTTNGTLLDEDALELALQQDILIAVSIDGVREAHDRHRRFADGSPSFDMVLARLRRLLELRPYASVLMVVNPDTVALLAESCSFLLDQGCRYLVMALNYTAAWDNGSLRELARQYRRLARLYEGWTIAGRKLYLSPFEVKLSSHIDGHCYRKDRCELAQRQISVDHRGYLYPCVQFVNAGPDSSWCIGHVSTGIDEQARQRILDNAHEEKESCAGCAVSNRCNNTCGCLNWQTTGSINQVSPVLCQHEQLLLPIADRLGERLYRRRVPGFLHKHYNSAYPVLSLLEETLEER